MQRISRLILFLVTLVALLFLLPHTYNPLTSISSSYKTLPKTVPLSYYDYPGYGETGVYDGAPTAGAPLRQRQNATLVMLASNSHIEGAVQSVHQMEDRFNRRYKYPWIFLNDEPFSDDFKSRVSVLASGPVHFGQIPADHWHQPSWIDEAKATEEREKMVKDGIGRSESVSYRNMCRFFSGFFFRHPLLQHYRYAWRVEPDVRYHCDVNFDPFAYLHENNKTYGFTIALYETRRTIESLWSTVKDFISQHPQYVAPDNAMSFLSDDGGAEYNLCMFYNNFEISDLDFWRGEAYTAYFDHLERTGGFYYERWGDAPVHSIAAALLAGKDRIHFFREIGYEHHPVTHCPAGDLWERGRCSCDPGRDFDYEGWSCIPKWDRIGG